MRARWTRLEKRVNAMSLRERFLLFTAIVMVLGGMTHLFFIGPLMRLQAQRAAQIEQRSANVERQMGRMQFDILERRRARAAELTSRVAAVDEQLAGVEREISALSESARAAVAVPAMLRRVLRRTDKVSLLRVAAVADTAAAAPPAGAPPASPGGLDITLGGGYLDLMEYLSALEAALPLARWSALRISAETDPPQATVRVVAPRVEP